MVLISFNLSTLCSMFTFALLSMITLFYMALRRRPEIEAHLNNAVFQTDGTHVMQHPRQIRPDVGSDPHTTGRPIAPGQSTTLAEMTSSLGVTPKPEGLTRVLNKAAGGVHDWNDSWCEGLPDEQCEELHDSWLNVSTVPYPAITDQGLMAQQGTIVQEVLSKTQREAASMIQSGNNTSTVKSSGCGNRGPRPV